LYIADALTSVLSQLDREDEYFVVDDSSTDQTCSIVEAYGDPRVRLLKSPRPGVSAARNAALKLASGEFVAFLDADDEWVPGRHAVMLQHFADHPEIDAVFGRIVMKFEPGAPLQIHYEKFSGAHVPSGVLGSGLFRQRILDCVDGFAEDMPHSEDIDFYNRLEEAGMKVNRLDLDAHFYRRHLNNLTNDQATSRRYFLEMIRRKLARSRARNQGAAQESKAAPENSGQ
jgi:glycosyltransferase involved in cell wall biosynthesis